MRKLMASAILLLAAQFTHAQSSAEAPAPPASAPPAKHAAALLDTTPRRAARMLSFSGARR